MKNRDLVVLIVLALAFVVASLVLVFSNPEPLQKKTFNASLRVAEEPGFDLTNSSLDFGHITPNGGIKRSIEVNNLYNYRVYAQPSVDGNITPFLSYKPITAIPKNQSMDIDFNANAPNKTYKEVNKTYSGNVSIRIWRAEDLN